ncbi:MAG: MATE family efflux transporter [Phycisphaerales bacterium]
MATTEAPKSADGSPLRELLAQALPTVATMASYTVMTFVDKLVVSKIGPDPVYVGAQGNGGLASWVPMSVAAGTLTIVATYVSQNLGAGKPERAPAYAWAGLWLSVAFWALVLVPYSFFIPDVLALAKVDPEQARIGAVYGQILTWGSVLTLGTRAISQFFFGLHKPGIVLLAGVVANVVNLVLTYGLVLGKFGLPALGVPGSAIGTVIAAMVELAIPMAVFLGPRLNASLRTRSSWRRCRTQIVEIVRLGWPGGAMFGNEMFCWGYFMVHLVSQFGREHATAGWIAHQYMSLSFMPAVGISVACTAVVGRCMGMKRPDLAAKRAWLGVGLAMVYMIACGVAFVVFRRPLVLAFVQADTPPEVAERLVTLGSAFLIATAAFQAFDAIAMTIGGALRGAGDTIVPGVATLFLSWIVIVGGGTAMVEVVPSLGSLGPWIAAASYIAVLSVFMLWRFLGGKWKTRTVVKEG